MILLRVGPYIYFVYIYICIYMHMLRCIMEDKVQWRW